MGGQHPAVRAGGEQPAGELAAPALDVEERLAHEPLQHRVGLGGLAVLGAPLGAPAQAAGDPAVRGVGDTATDQEGEEIEFDVAFFRTGPGNDDDGSADERVATTEDGTASYVFSGNTEGRARISAIGSDGNQVVEESQARDTVEFGEVGGPGTDPIEILLAADSNGPKKDIIRLQADEAAAGETVRLFVIRGTKARDNKRLIEIREDVVPEDGRLTFKKADRNGNRKTRFIAKIRTENGVAKSNTQKPR